MTGPSDLIPEIWPCEAYGPDGAEIGALCFVAEPGKRDCADQDTCHRTLAVERRRVYRRIQEIAAGGDEVGVHLEETFTHPDQLLGGPETAGQD